MRRHTNYFEAVLEPHGPAVAGLFIVTSVQMELIVLQWVPLSSRGIGAVPTSRSGNCRWGWRVLRTRPIRPRVPPGICWRAARSWTIPCERPPSEGATILLRSPPTPAALLLLTGKQTRERFKNLLHMANLEVDVCNVVADALERLSIRVHALLFTDDLELIRFARQLPAGVATHIVFVGESRRVAGIGSPACRCQRLYAE